MPTAAKLVSALVLALTGYLASQRILPFLPEQLPHPYLVPVAVVVPMICAWMTLGRMVGRSYAVSINSGLYGVAVSVFFVLGIFAVAEMVKRAMRSMYDGPADAVVSAFGILVEFGSYMVNTPVLTTLGIGAVVAGLGAEWTNRRWS